MNRVLLAGILLAAMGFADVGLAADAAKAPAGCKVVVDPYKNYACLEFVDDMQGQRTGTKTRFVETGIGWQHWFSPQIEIRLTSAA